MTNTKSFVESQLNKSSEVKVEATDVGGFIRNLQMSIKNNMPVDNVEVYSSGINQNNGLLVTLKDGTELVLKVSKR